MKGVSPHLLSSFLIFDQKTSVDFERRRRRGKYENMNGKFNISRRNVSYFNAAMIHRNVPLPVPRPKIMRLRGESTAPTRTFDREYYHRVSLRPFLIWNYFFFLFFFGNFQGSSERSIIGTKYYRRGDTFFISNLK